MSGNRVRSIILIILLSISLLLLAGCGTSYAGSPYLGTWISTTAKSGELTYSTTDLVGEYTMLFEKNGDVTVTCAGESEVDTWKPTKHGLTLQVASGTEYPIYEEDGRLILELKAMKFTFEKQGQTN